MLAFLLSIFLIALAAFFSAIRDRVNERFDNSIFSQINTIWIKRWFEGTTPELYKPPFIILDSANHFSKAAMLLCLFFLFLITPILNVYSILVVICIMPSVWGITFNYFYHRVLPLNKEREFDWYEFWH